MSTASTQALLSDHAGKGPSRWVVVADSPFLPARGGGEREHLGFIQAAVRRGLVGALILPTDADPDAHGRDDDIEAIRRLVAPAPVIITPRRRSLRSALSRRPYVVKCRPAPDGLADLVRQAAPDADAIVVFHYKSSGIGEQLAQDLRLPTVLRQHNLEGPYHHALAASARFPKSWAMHGEAWRIDRDERRLEHCQWLTGIADISGTDAQVRAHRSGVPVAHVPSFALGGLEMANRTTWTPPAEPVVTFLGALDVATNHDALTWFAEQAWPQVLNAVPGARWRVVGRRPTDAVRAMVGRTARAELHADVDDPWAHLLESSVAINPAVSGSGVNIKLVEYLSVGLPVVSTTRGAAGIGVESGSDLLVADDGAAFATAVTRMLSEPETATRLGSAGQRTATRILDVESSFRTVLELFDRSSVRRGR